MALGTGTTPQDFIERLIKRIETAAKGAPTTQGANPNQLFAQLQLIRNILNDQLDLVKQTMKTHFKKSEQEQQIELLRELYKIRKMKKQIWDSWALDSKQPNSYLINPERFKEILQRLATPAEKASSIFPQEFIDSFKDRIKDLFKGEFEKIYQKILQTHNVPEDHLMASPAFKQRLEAATDPVLNKMIDFWLEHKIQEKELSEDMILSKYTDDLKESFSTRGIDFEEISPISLQEYAKTLYTNFKENYLPVLNKNFETHCKEKNINRGKIVDASQNNGPSITRAAAR